MADEKVVKSCSSCAHYSSIEGECRRRAPSMFPMVQGPGQFAFIAGFPPMKPNNWCGEYEKHKDD